MAEWGSDNTSLSKHRHCSFLNSPLTVTTNDITSSTHVAKWNPTCHATANFLTPLHLRSFSTSHRHHRLGVRAILQVPYSCHDSWTLEESWMEGRTNGFSACPYRALCGVRCRGQIIICRQSPDIFLNCTATASCLCQKKVDG
ncbi:hypothetical protein CEXT_380121 [Caerostris extrusa]|uniref:Uncharacterized protein n=1 Tax=Caerostris extrusa TaxID=172846 RepID=A0AAV4TJJ9_CAEEX|nr:hypothetical protein CEXT_380121 [Caerostris extrusa]